MALTPSPRIARPVVTRRRGRTRLRGDRGVADTGIEMMFGTVFVIALVLLVIEAVGYWHARNILDEAAAEGARVAAAFDGTCGAGTAETNRLITARAQGWAQGAAPQCGEANNIVTMTVTSGTPGFLFDAVGFSVSVTQSAPRER